MSYRGDEFRDYFVQDGGSPSTSNIYRTFLNKIDVALQGLDEFIAKNSKDAVLEWSRGNDKDPFDKYPGHAKAALKKYIQFLIDLETPSDPALAIEEPDSLADVQPALAFRIEKEMQAAVRRQLANLELGLIEEDGGYERQVATGRIDIVARDSKGGLVAIELKAGQCPSGALEQALGYAEALADETGEPVRAVLIASEFPDRIRAAARRVRDTKLVTYEFSLAFKEVV